MNRNNILILNHHANAPDKKGGGRHFDLGEKLSSKGYNIEIIASSYDNSKKEYRTNSRINTHEFNSHFKFTRIKSKPAYTNMVGRFLNYIDYMIKTSKLKFDNDKPDIIIASSVHPLTWVSGYRLSRKYNSKFIVEVRDLWPLSFYEDFSQTKRKLFFPFFEHLEKKYYKLADAIITTAPYADEYINEKYRVNKDKIFHIPHGIDIEKFDNNVSNPLEENINEEIVKALEKNFSVTYTGALSQSEGLATLVESAKYLKDLVDLKIIIIGSGPELEKLENIVNKQKLSNVIFYESQPRDAIPLYLEKSDLLFTGLIDRKAFEYGISKNKFYDYMSASKPIIFASNVRGSLIDMSKSGVTISPGDPKLLAKTIRKIYKEYNYRDNEFGNNAREYVEKNHTLDTIADKFIEVFNYTK